MPSYPFPVDIGAGHWLTGSGHTVRLVDLLVATAPTWIEIGVVAAILVVLWLVAILLSRRAPRREVSVKPEDFSMPCPNCGSEFSSPIGSFEKRRCESCGQRFSLKD